MVMFRLAIIVLLADCRFTYSGVSTPVGTPRVLAAVTPRVLAV